MKKTFYIVLILVLLLTGCGTAAEPEYRPKTAEDYEPYAAELVEILKDGYDMVFVAPQIEGQNVVFSVSLSKNGVSHLVSLFKAAGLTEDESYLDWVSAMQDLSLDILTRLQRYEIENVHVELLVLDDIDVENYADGKTEEVRSLLEIYDGELIYEFIKD